jgi:hypothetical protein
MGQQKVNDAAPAHPSGPELIWLSDARCPASPSHHETVAPTFNPKVAGSIPARPIPRELTRADTKGGPLSRPRHPNAHEQALSHHQSKVTGPCRARSAAGPEASWEIRGALSHRRVNTRSTTKRRMPPHGLRQSTLCAAASACSVAAAVSVSGALLGSLVIAIIANGTDLVGYSAARSTSSPRRSCSQPSRSTPARAAGSPRRAANRCSRFRNQVPAASGSRPGDGTDKTRRLVLDVNNS